ILCVFCIDIYIVYVYNISIESEVSNMPMTPKQMIKLLKKNGFYEVSQNGSHKKFRDNNGHQTIVPMHNKDLGKGLEDTILKQAGLK
ncbi:toxin-antitoxin system, toxin component, HicA family, partial [Streptococcus pyogenes ATCC 10782]